MSAIFSIYKWEDLAPNSPRGQTRNQWLYEYGAFGCYRGIWFPCTVSQLNMLGEPAYVTATVVATTNDYGLYPKGLIAVQDMDFFYTTFNSGLPIRHYIHREVQRTNTTRLMLDGAIQRSLHTEIVGAPKNILNSLKAIINQSWRGERKVIETTMKDDIAVIELPHTANLLEKLWDSNDWAKQEICEMLGISFNPSHGKKERLLVDEINGDRDITVMNRLRLTERLIEDAEKYGEYVIHISDYVSECNKEERSNMYGENIIQGTDTESRS